jgi:ribosomal protein S12 methylthiotransferase accessory factor
MSVPQTTGEKQGGPVKTIHEFRERRAPEGSPARSPSYDCAQGVADRARKNYVLGTHRTVSPAETLARLTPLLPEMGITRVANITGLDLIGIPVVMVSRPNSRSIAVAQGKGLDLAAAKVSGLMEAVETYHAERVSLPLRLASYRDLNRTEPVADVSRLPFSVQSRYGDDLAILWVAGQDQNEGSSVWLPYELVHTDYTLPLPQGSGCFAANTNGLASGNHRLEAISHGLGEVIERDALTLWKRLDDEACHATVLDLDTVDDPACRQTLEQLDRAEVDMMVWDATSDVGIPTFNCLLVGRQKFFADPEFGSGCHPDRGVALSRALTEAVQARTTYIAGTRDDFLPDLYAEPVRAKRLSDCRALLDSQDSGRPFREIPSFESATIADDIDWMVRCLARAGMEQVLVVDLTRPEFGIPVVRVVVPGLEGPDKGSKSDYVPGLRARALMGAAP